MGIFSALLAPLLAFYTVIVEPFLGTSLYRNLRKQLAADPSARTRFYRSRILLEWGWVVVIAIIIILKPEGLTLMGLNLPSLTGWIITAAAIVGIGISTILIRRNPGWMASTQRSLKVSSALLPSTRAERSWFAAAAVTAGICEELLYRGFLIFFLQTTFPSLFNQFILLSIISGIIYGLSRAYQGQKGILQASLYGLVFALVFYLSGNLLMLLGSNPPAALIGSLLPVMVLHALLELQSLWLWQPVTAEIKQAL